MKYKAGESVRVKSGLKGMRTTKVFVTAEMEEKEGKTVVITEVDPCSKIYRADGVLSWFEEEMFEPIEQFSAGGVVINNEEDKIVVTNDPRISIKICDMTRIPCVLDNISFVASSVRRHKSGIESRKEIRKRLLKL